VLDVDGGTSAVNPAMLGYACAKSGGRLERTRLSRQIACCIQEPPRIKESTVSTHVAPDLVRLLADGKTYLWALRQSQQELSPDEREALRAEFDEAGIDLAALAALRQLEYPIARFTYPAARRVDHREYLYFPIPAFDIELYFNEVITEHGVELGTELFPGRIEWTFGHREIQYCTGGDTTWTFVNPDGSESVRRIRVGDVGAYPAGTQWICDSSEEGGRFGHAHIFLLNLGESEGQIYYDAPGLLRLQALGILDVPEGAPAPEFVDISERIEVTDWRELVQVCPEGQRDLPTWLRNGWAAREATRALDYAEGTRTIVMSSPDRPPEDYLEWGSGRHRCYVNPLIAEHTAGITDCRFPAGYSRALPKRELWCVLSGQATVRQSIPIFHSEWVEYELSPGWAMAVSGAAHVHVTDATDDFVVRRMAESGADNGHALMMERKLEADGVPANL